MSFEYPPVENNINITGISSFIRDIESTDVSELEKRIVQYEDDNYSERSEEESIDFEEDCKNQWHAMRSKLGISADISDDETDIEEPSSDPHISSANGYPHTQNYRYGSQTNKSEYIGNIPEHRSRSEYFSRDPHMSQLSEEQRRQQILQSAIDSRETIPMSSGSDINMDFEKSEDKKNMLLEEINMLRTSLTDEGANIDDVTVVTFENSFSEIDSVYKQLRYRNDHRRYCMFANEMTQMGAAGLEWMFDGKKTYIGGLRPDLTDWGATLNIKMRRLNYEMSSVVSAGMRRHNISEFGRILLELIPSMILHSKMRKKRFGSRSDGGGQPSNNVDFMNAMNMCRDIEEDLRS